jgi:hypothetical protein
MALPLKFVLRLAGSITRTLAISESWNGCPLQVLDGLERDGGMAPARLATARSAYENLRQAALLALSGLSAVQQRVTQLLSQLQRVQAEQEAALAGSTDPAQLLDKFRGDRELARLEVGGADGMPCLRACKYLKRQLRDNNSLSSAVHGGWDEGRQRVHPTCDGAAPAAQDCLPHGRAGRQSC